VTPTGSPACAPPAPTPERRRGGLVRTPRGCWPLMWTARCWMHTRQSRVRPGPPRAASGSIRCWRTWTVAMAPARRSPVCCGRATPAPTPPKITSTWSTWRSPSCPPPPAPSRCWSAPTPAAPPTPWASTYGSVACGSRSACQPTSASAPPCWPCPQAPGSLRSTPAASHARAPRWPSCTPWSLPAGQKGRGRSAAARTHPGAQLTFTDVDGHASRCSSPTSPTPTSPCWSCATATAPASRTASAAARPPGCVTSPSTCRTASIQGPGRCRGPGSGPGEPPGRAGAATAAVSPVTAKPPPFTEPRTAQQRGF
jgi:hypothetical protein